MNCLIAAALVVLVAAITPGPNNLVVMRAAARGGMPAAVPAMAGIVLGSIALLAMAVAGVGAAIGSMPALGRLIGICGGVYLMWLGASLWRQRHETPERALPAGVGGLFAFQFLNPKAWAMVLSVAATMQATSTVDTFLQLAPLFAVIPAICLTAWAGLGSALSRQLTHPARRAWIDRAMGASLIASALVLLV